MCIRSSLFYLDLNAKQVIGAPVSCRSNSLVWGSPTDKSPTSPQIKEPGIISTAFQTTPVSYPPHPSGHHKACSICSQFKAQLHIKLQQICLEEELLRPAVPGAITALSFRGCGEIWHELNTINPHNGPSSQAEREGGMRVVERGETRRGWGWGGGWVSACRCSGREEAEAYPTPPHTPPVARDRR